MAKKSSRIIKGFSGLVYSTNPDFKPEPEEPAVPSNLEPSRQRLIVRIDRRQRKGKEVTLVEGFIGPEQDLEALGKMLKTRCGAGGSVKEGQILIQGDVRDKVVLLLEQSGYSVKRGN